MASVGEEIKQLRAAVDAQEALRGTLPDAVLDTVIATLRGALAALEVEARADQTRKQITVVFADVSGFTALSETLDAEYVAGVMNDLWVLADAAILEHGGRIDKHIGDAVMALWGSEAAREDDPEQAVRAALAMQEAVAAFCTTHRIPLALRVGVNTGPALLGAVGTMGEFTAIGDAVNLASRLEQAAPVGGVLISHDTYRHVRGVFDVQPQQPILFKGKAEPVRAYVVQRAKPRAFRMATRGVEGIETRMVGREAEMLVLQAAYFDALESIATRAVTVVGEAGVGKSRLLYEFDNWIELRPETAWTFKGRGTPNTQSVPLSLFRDLFAYRFEILDSDSAAVALDKFRAGMAGTLEPERADVVGHWLGFDFSSSEAVNALLGGGDLAALGRAYLMRYFWAVGQADRLHHRAVVIFLEDIHWADDTSLDLAVHLVEALPAARLLVVCAARPIFLERRPGWGEGQVAFRSVHLTPLSMRASRALVDEILERVDEVPDVLRNLIIDAAEGNPFYVEEVVKMLIEQGVIERAPRDEVLDSSRGARRATGVALSPPEIWHIRPEKLEGLRVPPTLTALLQARLDGLPRPEQEALHRASVVGRLFWDDAVADLAQTPVAELRPTLAAVHKRELIFRRERSSFVESEEYIFKHALLRDVAYERVLLKQRAEFHGRVARWLEAHAGERIGEFLGLISEHYVQAGEGLRAAGLLERSGHEAAEAGLHSAARRALERALALREAAGEVDGPAVTRAAIALGLACTWLGDLSAADAALDRGLAGARAAGDAAAAAEALTYLAEVAFGRGQDDRTRALLEEALPAARAVGGRAIVGAILVAGQSAEASGDLDSAEIYFREALELARSMRDLTWEVFALNSLASIASERHDLDEAERLSREVLAMARRANNPSLEASALGGLGVWAYYRGDYAAAVAYAGASLTMARDLDNDQERTYALSNLAQANIGLGELRAAREGAIEALAQARKMGSPFVVAWMVSLFGRLLIAEGNRGRGLALYGLARAHPALDSAAHIRIDEELAALGLPPEELTAGLSAGAALDFEIVVQEILDGKW